MKVTFPTSQSNPDTGVNLFTRALFSNGSAPLYPTSEKVNQSFLEKQIEAVTAHRPEQDSANTWISASEAQILAGRYGQAWNVENYLPKAGSYRISDFAKAILAKFERTDDEGKIAGCNPKCDASGVYFCTDGIISEKEATATAINGDYLFSTDVKVKPYVDLRPEADSSVLARPNPPSVDNRFEHGGETNSKPSTVTKNSNNREFPTENGGETNRPSSATTNIECGRP